MLILLVEDDEGKRNKIIPVIKSVQGISDEEIHVARSSVEARRFLLKHQYDLVILDLAIPEHLESVPDAKGGVRLLEEIEARAAYRKPRHIVGLTAFEDLAIESGPVFAEGLWGLVHYEPNSADWIELIKRKVKHVFLSLDDGVDKQHKCELAIVTALEKPEFRAVLALDWNWRSLEPPSETVVFQEGSFESQGERRKVIAVSSTEMGMVAATIMANKLIYNFRPRYLVMVGIVAGVPGRCNFGDVIVADPCWDYGSGKVVSKDGTSVLIPAPYQMRMPLRLRKPLQKLTHDSAKIQEIYQKWRGPRPSGQFQVIVGPMASGAAVRADGKVIAELESQQHRKILGLEMEAYGVLSAAYSSPLPEVTGLVMKSVSDFADPGKTDSFQEYAAYTSAETLRLLAENHLSFSSPA